MKTKPEQVRKAVEKSLKELQTDDFDMLLLPGTQDWNGCLMTGTECNYIVVHNGWLYAAVGTWNHDRAASNTRARHGCERRRSMETPAEYSFGRHA